MHVETVLVQRCSCVQLADILRYKTCIKIAAKTLSVPLSYPCVFNQTQPRRLGGKCEAHAYRGVNPDRQTNRRMEHSVIVAPSLCGREERRQFFLYFRAKDTRPFLLLGIYTVLAIAVDTSIN